MSKPETKIYCIRHKESGALWKAPSGKSSWRKQGHAKSAWATLCQGYNSAHIYANRYGVDLVPYQRYDGDIDFAFPKFDEQDVYELIEINNLAGELVQSLREIIEGMIEHLPEDKKQEYLMKYGELKNV
jgi:DNA-directed RNA polymerase specialized sigma24 family protein